ncbi:hypothetical protein SNE25_09985 [Mucilaginibacter sabulilitoris]|uniref:YD repeat-containing protein n=1 Tax=Mucilaginibacter sabulilitoris TaxID=1173583 RepID=A0ABZ0TRU9_9SPHI|nr:hypothetical protein [Mucilaginibacter sabulilitoris]WPU95846.1 hypothetical protein SNE25_09985 [Mucilaginibacter sabulilitoris]
MKFVDVPVSPYTGTADVNIPIYTIHAKGIDIPISLGYHTGGIRLDEEASWVGLGWALNAGGMISRTINDKDDLGGMYFNQPVPQLQGDISDHQPAECAGLQNAGFKYIVNFFDSYNVNFLTGPGNAETGGDFYQPFNSAGPNQPFDLEPDSYSYNVLGMSGKFIIKRDKTIVQEKQDNTRIQIANNGPTDATIYFIITDNKGIKYYFEQTQAVLPTSASGGTPSSWFLTKIVTQQNDVISFNYSGSGFVTTPTLKTQSYRPYLSFGNQYTESSNTGTQYNNVNLQNITYNGGQVTFTSDNVRNDLSGAYKLNAVNIYAKNTTGLKLLKSHNLYYSYFVALGAQGGTTEANRLRLDSIKEVSGSQTIKPYVFSYNFDSQASNVQLTKRSYNMDHWGFYNGAANSVLIPSASVYYNNMVDAPGVVNYSGANRDPSFPSTQTFSLQKITYPTGGSTVMEYEANDYNYRRSLQSGQEFLPQTLVHVDTMITPNASTSGTIDVSKIFPLINPGVQGYNFNITVTFRASNFSTGWSQQDLNTFNKLGFIVNGDQTDLSSAPCSGIGACIVRTRFYQLAIGQVASRTPIPWSFYYDSSAIPPGDIGDAFIRFSYDILKSTPETNPVLPAGGIRIKSLTDYSSDGTVAKKRTWNYHYGDNNELTNGLLMSFPAYVREEIVHVDYGGVAGEFLLHQLVMFGTTNTPLTSGTSGNVVGYSQVTETTIDPSNSVDNGKVVYNYVNIPDSVIAYNKLRFPGMNNVRHSLNGSLLSQLTYRKVGNAYAKVKEINNFYHTANRKSYYSAKYQTNLLANHRGSCDSAIAGVPNAGFAEFYPSIISEKVLQDSTQEITYDNDTTKYIVSSSKMFYDNPAHYQLTRQVTTDSRGNKHVSKVTYPQDYIVSGGLTNNTILDTLIRRNMLAETIEKRDSIFYRGVATGLVDAASFTKYKQLNTGTVVPDKMYKLDVVKPVNDFQGMMVSGNTISQDSRYRQLINFDGYDHVGNVSQYTVTDKPPVSIIWDYKRVSPIAQVSNADSLSVAYTSFEADGMGHWSVASATRVTTNALSGANAYNLGNGSISKSGLTATNNYIVSYWTTNTGPLTIAGTMSGYPVKGATNKGWTYYEHQITGVSTVTVSGTGNIDELRLYPAGGQMTTYTYDPLVGVTSLTDAKNQVSYYEYDGFQRLRDVRDQDGNIVKHVDYHYQGQ